MKRSIFLVLAYLAAVPFLPAQEVLLQGHSHNDYLRERPLYDALVNGMFSVEVDIWPVNRDFIVAHHSADIWHENSLEKMYLRPLKAIIEGNEGRVYENGPMEFRLVLDLKGTWDHLDLLVLEDYLTRYRSLLTVHEEGQHHPGAVRIVLSGNEGKFGVTRMEPRYFSVDGGLDAIDGALGSEIVCRISERYRKEFDWKGKGSQPEAERTRLRQLVNAAHEQGRTIRFWDVPEKPVVWEALLDAGVDWINVNDPERFREYMSSRSGKGSP